MTQEQKKAGLESFLARGGVLLPVPDGPVLGQWNSLEFAQAIEFALDRAVVEGHTKLRFDLTFEDAALMATFVRRAIAQGV